MSKFDMSLTQVESAQLEENKVKLTIQIDADVFKQSLRAVYNRNKGYFNIPGFRKGKAPRVIVEQYYGKEVFHEDAINGLLEDAYEYALEKSGTKAVYRPDIDLGPVSETDGVTVYAEVYTHPAVSIDGYYGLTYPKADAEPTEEDVQNALRSEQEKNARHVSADRAAEIGDITTINFEGFVDGVPFEGGKGEFVDLTLGSNRFIPGFEEQLVGAKTGDDVKVEVTFPEDYNHADLAGKEAVFQVEIIDVKVKEMPELDDDFAQDISEFDTLAEYRTDLVEKLRKSKETDIDHAKRTHIMKKLAELAVVDVPEVMYTGRVDDMLDNFRRQIQMQGMDFENYLRFSGMTETNLRSGWQAQAKLEVDSMLALDAVAQAEGLTVSEEDFRTEFLKMPGVKEEEADKLIADMHPRRKEDMTASFLCDKALEFVLEKAIATDEPLPEVVVNGDVIDINESEDN